MKTLNPPDKEWQAPPAHIELLLWLYQDNTYRAMHILTHALKKADEEIEQSLAFLSAQGCTFYIHPQQGIRLQSIGLGAWIDILEAETGWPYQRFEVYQTTASTQDICKRYAKEQGKASLGTVVIADEQTSGRGRRGNDWQAPAGSALLFSFIGNPTLSPERYAHTVVHDLFKGLQSHAVRQGHLTLKWPNDIYLDSKKLAGILIEYVNGMPVIGIGINTHVTPEQYTSELRDIATSLHNQPHLPDRSFLLADLLRDLGMHGVCYSTEVPYDTRWKVIQDSWRNNCHMLGRRFTFLCEGVEYIGECVDVDIAAGLIVRRDTGEIVTLPAATTSVAK